MENKEAKIGLDYDTAKKQITQIYTEAERRLCDYTDPLEYGPAHIVWADDNYGLAEDCLETFDIYNGYPYAPEYLAIVRWSLEELRKIPQVTREAIADSGWSVHGYTNIMRDW